MKDHPTKMTLVWFACLSMLGFLATDMYLPAFSLIQDEFATTQQYIGLSLSIFLLGMALGQIVYGPLSDRIGRIKVLVSGMLLFSLASLLAAFSANFETFLVARFLQALGACSAAVIWQSVVIDRYSGKVSERIFATIMPLVALSPALAPILGSVLEGQFGWRSIFVVLAIFGGVFGVAGGFGVGTAAFDVILSHLLLIQNGALIGLLFQIFGALSRMLGLPFYLMARQSSHDMKRVKSHPLNEID